MEDLAAVKFCTMEKTASYEPPGSRLFQLCTWGFTLGACAYASFGPSSLQFGLRVASLNLDTSFLGSVLNILTYRKRTNPNRYYTGRAGSILLVLLFILCVTPFRGRALA